MLLGNLINRGRIPKRIGRRAPGSKRPIEEILKEHARQVPPEEWAKLPDDLIDRLDYYTAGADR